MRQSTIVTLYLDEINIQNNTTFSNKVHLFGPFHNYLKEISTFIQVFLLSTLYSKNYRINVCLKSVYNIKSEYLKNLLMKYLDKQRYSKFVVVPIMLDSTL